METKDHEKSDLTAEDNGQNISQDSETQGECTKRF